MPTPLHVRSGYSLLRGTALPQRLIEQAAALGYAQLALTDVNNLYGATLFYRQACQAGLAPTIGAELVDGPLGALALVTCESGYENLCRLISRIHARQDELPAGFAPPVTSLAQDLAELYQGLELVMERPDQAEALLAAGVPKERLWLGIDPPNQGPWRSRCLAEAAERLDLPLVATLKADMASADDFELARLLAAIRTCTTFDQVAPAELPPAGAHLRNAADWPELLRDFPRALANNVELAGRCHYALLPRRPVFPDFDCPDGLAAGAYLRRLCERGMAERYGDHPADRSCARLDRELRLIGKMGFSEYFLVVWDIVQYARRRGAPVAGRGSGASSLVAYVLGITNVCPLAFDIPFERFLNEGREDFPDLDIDFCWRIRDDVIAYAINRWGRDHVAMVSMHGMFQPASAVREAAKALGLSNEQVSRLAEGGPDVGDLDAGTQPRAAVPHAPNTSTEANVRDRYTRRHHGRDVHVGSGNASYARIAALARRLLGLPHNISVHPGGIVIGRKGIDHYVPIQPSAKGVMITQYDKNGVEDIRLVKLDLLGNRNLSTVRYACDLIHGRRGLTVDIERLGGDEATFAMLRRGDTVGCNQLESPAMRSLLKMMQPRRTEDVMQALALIRPGAASIGMKEVFIRRRRGLEGVPAGHPAVDAILRPTHGVMLYEDDVLLVAAALLGGGMAQADHFRKSVQKCCDDAARLELSRAFLGSCRENGVDLDYAKNLWVQMAKFNAYSFCRAHAASYAALAYAGAYLKTHYPLEFWTACLNNNQSMYPPRVYVEQARRAGIDFLPPDANESEEEFSIAGQAIRIGFNRVSALGPVSVATILAARRQGRFAGLSDFISRTGLGREEARCLILCGAFDAFARPRPALMIELDLHLAHRPARAARPAGPALLAADPALPESLVDYTPLRKYLDERRVLGLSARGHLLGLYREQLLGVVDADSRSLASRIGRTVRLAGLLEALRDTHTDSGKRMMFLTLDDEHGLFEVTVFPGLCDRLPRLDAYGPYVITGKVEDQYGAITVSAQAVELYGSQAESMSA